MYWDKILPNLISSIARVTFQEVVGGAQRCYAHMRMCSQLHECIKIFTVQKIRGKNFRAYGIRIFYHSTC